MLESERGLHFLKEPNKQQLQAIQHTLGPALVLAGPGSGKTYTIIQRILFLITKKNIPPQNILVVTFSKAAAKELQERFRSAITLSNIRGEVHFGTFHSLGFFLLQQSGNLQPHALVTDYEKRKYLEIILKKFQCSELCHYEKMSYLMDSLSKIKNCPEKSIDLSILPMEQELFLKVRKEYDTFLREQGKIDFDDMILLCLEMFYQQPELLNQYCKLFSYILVDEFQDINKPQYEMLRLLSGPSSNLYAVGDDDQSIYGFRGSSPNIMKQFLLDYPEAGTYMLTSNFRSGRQIVCFSEKVINQNHTRFSKSFLPQKAGGDIFYYHFETHKEEEAMLLTHLKEHSGECYENTAIILRTNHEASLFRNHLRKNGIPVSHVESAGDLYHSFVMEDFSSFLSYVYEGHKREDFLRFMNKPNRFLQRSALLSEVVSADSVISFYQSDYRMQQEARTLFQSLELAGRLSPPFALRLFCQSMGYHGYLKEKSRTTQEYDANKKRTNEIIELFQNYTFHQKIRDYISTCQSHAEISHTKTIHAGVKIITMHASKGLEFEHVYLPDVNEGIIPSKKCITPEQLEEERRLLYVAITRAKTKLFLYETAERNRVVSRFIADIIPQNPNIHQIPDYPDIHQMHPPHFHIPHHR